MEVFMFVEAGGATASIDILPFAGSTLSVDVDWDPAACECPRSAFQFSMLEVIRACGSAQSFNRRVGDIVRNASAQSEQEHRPSSRSRRLSGTLRLGEELGHLVRHFDKYRPGCWWVNILLLVVRLMSTSLVALWYSQASQAVLASIVSLACTGVLYSVQPYREDTDNLVSVSGQVLIFCWVYFLLVRVIGVLKGIWTVLGGVALVAASIGLFTYALRVVYTDCEKMAASTKDAPATTEEEDPRDDRASDESDDSTHEVVEAESKTRGIGLASSQRSSPVSQSEQPLDVDCLMCGTLPTASNGEHTSEEV